MNVHGMMPHMVGPSGMNPMPMNSIPTSIPGATTQILYNGQVMMHPAQARQPPMSSFPIATNQMQQFGGMAPAYPGNEQAVQPVVVILPQGVMWNGQGENIVNNRSKKPNNFYTYVKGAKPGQKKGAQSRAKQQYAAPMFRAEEEETQAADETDPKSRLIAIERQCEHNNWDNVRVKRGIVTFGCRECGSKWKCYTKLSGKCPIYFEHAICPMGTNCPQLHVN
eukprot:gene504-1798_t